MARNISDKGLLTPGVVASLLEFHTRQHRAVRGDRPSYRLSALTTAGIGLIERQANALADTVARMADLREKMRVRWAESTEIGEQVTAGTIPEEDAAARLQIILTECQEIHDAMLQIERDLVGEPPLSIPDLAQSIADEITQYRDYAHTITEGMKSGDVSEEEGRPALGYLLETCERLMGLLDGLKRVVLNGG